MCPPMKGFPFGRLFFIVSNLALYPYPQGQGVTHAKAWQAGRFYCFNTLSNAEGSINVRSAPNPVRRDLECIENHAFLPRLGVVTW